MTTLPDKSGFSNWRKNARRWQGFPPLRNFYSLIRFKSKDLKDDNTAGHEGELTAAKRLALKVIELYGPRFVDVFTTDALYLNYPFVSLVKKELNKDIIAKVKREDSSYSLQKKSSFRWKDRTISEIKNGWIQ